MRSTASAKITGICKAYLEFSSKWFLIQNSVFLKVKQIMGKSAFKKKLKLKSNNYSKITSVDTKQKVWLSIPLFKMIRKTVLKSMGSIYEYI